MSETEPDPLQEANDADLLLHVVDCASPVLAEQMAEVRRVLAEIGAAEIPQVLVFNKLDRLEEDQRPRALRDHFEVDAGVRLPRVFVSAIDGTGLTELRQMIGEASSGTLAGLNGTYAAPDLAEAEPDAEDALDDDEDPSVARRTRTFHSLS